jgi:hypothetical protein
LEWQWRDLIFWRGWRNLNLRHLNKSIKERKYYGI